MATQQGEDSLEKIIEKVKSMVGRKTVYRSPDGLARSTFRQYALGVADFNPLYTDREFAQKHGYKDAMAPPTLVCDTFQFIDSDIKEVGDMVGRRHAEGLLGLRAGNDYEFFKPVYPDDVITARWTITGAVERTGKSGRLIFQTVEAKYFNQNNELVAINSETMFFRPEFQE